MIDWTDLVLLICFLEGRMSEGRKQNEMKTGKRQEWQDIVLSTEKLVKEWQNLVSHDNGTEKLESWFGELGNVLNDYRRLKNGNGFEKLTKREREIVGLICMGKTNDEISRTLNIFGNTVESHRGNIFNKLQVRNSQELILLAVKGGMVR